MQSITNDSRQAADLVVTEYNETYMKVIASSQSIEEELTDAFTFMADNYRFHPKVKAGVWDGKLRSYNRRHKTIFKGLLHRVVEFADSMDYTIAYEGEFGPGDFSLEDARASIANMGIPEKFEMRDYQVETFASCVRHRRRLFVSPTSSGKSLIIYMLYRHMGLRTLLVVPKINLVKQMTKDFRDYGYGGEIHQVYGGQEKTSETAMITVTTWQSIYEQPHEFFGQFDMIIGDEAHRFKAKSLIEIMEKATNIRYRFGFTGTLDESSNTQTTLEGLFGPKEQIITTRELIDAGYASEISIHAICLVYPEHVKKFFTTNLNTLRRSPDQKTKKKAYPYEIQFLIENEARNGFIRDMARSLPGNGLILFQRVEKHGKVLHEMLSRDTKVPVYLVHGKVDAEDRESIREIVSTHKDSIICASMGCFSEGTNMPDINWIILAHPSRDKIGVLQRIGRGLRMTATKKTFDLYDISDELTTKRAKINKTLEHLAIRIKYYIQERFPYKLHRVKLSHKKENEIHE